MKQLWYILVSLRPKQWTKNLVLFAGIIYSKGFLQTHLIAKSIAGFIIFCLLSGAVYILNDLFDRARDLEHPKKKNRPIASGALTSSAALISALALMAALIVASWFLGKGFFYLAIAFLAVNGTYSILLRHVVILDVIAISFSFLIRAGAGVVVLHTDIPDLEFSPWLWICTLFLSLFLAICKRRNEFSHVESATAHRIALKEYSSHLLDQLVGLSATATIISYSIYTVWPATITKFGTTKLVYTIPFVVFGIMRYLYLVYNKNEGGDPSGVLVTEKAIMIDVFLWFVVTAFIILKA